MIDVSNFKNSVILQRFKIKIFVIRKIHLNNTEKMKNAIDFKGNWNEIKGKLKQQFAQLTDNDLLLAEGRKEELIGKLQIKLGKTKEEINKIIANL